MAYYAVGDIQGCYDPLAKLLDKVNFDTNKDTLYCVGDLVNRGPKSLKTLRLLKSLNSQCVSVLGNHDIHLLSMLYGIRKPRPNDTLNKTLEAHDAHELGDWLRNMPLLVVNEERRFAMCHAGIYPWWSLAEARDLANEVETVFKNKDECITLLKHIYSNKPSKWKTELHSFQRYTFIINAFTRMRFCSPKGHLNFTESGYKGKSTKNRKPWIHFPNASLNNYRIIFGHWSALGLINTPNLLSLDTGCVWGREMTLAKIPKSQEKLAILYTQKP